MRIVRRGRRLPRRQEKKRPPPQKAFDRAVAEFFMHIALAEARKGLGRTSPNPAVGAVLVRNGRVLARGYHVRAGGPHAEIVALRRAGGRASGSELYTTLEPCNHFGRTPPCTEAIIAAGIRRVIVGCRDLNPRVSGRGIRRLRQAGVSVSVGVLESECAALNEPFFTFAVEGRPFVTLKMAATADGKIATATGDSRWVTGPAARERVHQLRARVDAVLVGAGTVRADDPQLTARPRGRLPSRQPLRVVLSAALDLPLGSRLLRSKGGPVLVVTSSRDTAKAGALRRLGAEVVRVPGRRGAVNLKAMLRELARRDVLHLLVEGGADVAGQFLQQGLVDELLLFIAPKILGEGLGWARLNPRRLMAQALDLGTISAEPVGVDLLLRSRLRAPRRG